jgi:hypothetical protein
MRWSSLVLACLLICASLRARADVKTDYKTPLVTVPYAWTKPVLDGVIDDREWQGAESVNALQTTNHQVSPRQTRFWMQWDEDTLYMAMRSPLRPGERVIQALRNRARDINVVFDDSYEVWLNVGTKTPDGQPTFFQFLCNVAGARYDVLHEPAVGNSRLGWTSGWEPKNRLTPDGSAWEWEMAIPRASIYKTTPFADDFELSCLIARNFKRPWEQNSFEGTSSFSVCDTHSRYRLSKRAPAIHLLRVADPLAKTFGLELAAVGQQDGACKWRFQSDGGANHEGVLQVKKGQLSALAPALNLDTPGKGAFRITVTSADGAQTYLDWCAQRAFGDLTTVTQKLDDKGDQVGLTLEFNPVSNYIRVSGDFIDYDARATIAKCQVAVADSTGKRLAQQDFTIDALAYVQGTMKLGDLPFGDYTASLTAMRKDGTVVLSRESKFSKKDHAKAFPWWNTPHGNIERVIEPWTPVTLQKGRIGVWGRTMQLGAAGLPAQITAQGRNLLARPATLVAQLPDGKMLTASGVKTKTLGQAEHRIVSEVASKLGDMKVTSKITAEFDGMYRVDLTLTPTKPMNVKSLKVVVPFTPATADYVHACGEGIRYGYYYGFLPKDKRGRIWDCLTVDSQPMAVGSFIPYLWIGNPTGGLCWFADSDQGWAPNNDTPAIEVRRDSADSTDLVLNLVSAPLTLDAPRTVSFAFQASPVKPLHKGWRMDSWWTDDTFRDFSCRGDIIWTAVPFTVDVEKCKQMVEARHQSPNSYIFGINKYKANAVPYFIHQSLPATVPEVRYFGDEWRTSVSEGLVYGKSLQDYMIHNLGEWSKATGIDGYYIDNMRPLACDNLDAGRGYRLPDGKIQPTYQMFDTRAYFLRMRAVFAEQGRHNKVVLHMTNNMILPWVGAAGIAYDGEHHVIYPELNKDFMDYWTLERMRVDISGQWGVAVNFMHEYQGNWEQSRLKQAMRAYTGMVLLHDGLPSGNANGMNPECWIGRDRFGIEADDVRFLGYWEANTGLASKTKDVHLAGWLRPGKVLVAVVNTGEAGTATLTLDATKLGLPAAAGWKVWDAETKEALTHDATGTIAVPMKRHDYRQLIIEAK